MIQLFRRIRQRLLSEGSFSKYSIYALGEIVLVVIGILIALQINNWNENRKLLQQEHETVASLKLEFQKNLNSLQGDMLAVQGIMNAAQELLEYTGPDYQNGTLPIADSLIGHTLAMSVWDPSLYTLSNIKNSGKLSTLSNEELKLLLIEWEGVYSNLEDWSDFYVDRGTKYFDFLLANAVTRKLDTFGPFEITPSRFKGTNQELLRNTEFENHLLNKVIINGSMYQFYDEARALMELIIAQCDQYID